MGDQNIGRLGWVGDIEAATLENDNFRRVLFTGEHAQLTVMHLNSGEQIGWESHDNLDQFLRLEQGSARIDLGRAETGVDESHAVWADWAVIIPAGVWHNVTNVGDIAVKLYSLYTPPEHPADTVHSTKAQADAAEEHH